MSQGPKRRHGPELKCGGPGVCQDCTERRRADLEAEASGLLRKLAKPTIDVDPEEIKRRVFWSVESHMGALQDRVHVEHGKIRKARISRRKK